MGIDHRGLEIDVAEQGLDRAYIGARLQEVGRKGMAKRVHGDVRQAADAHCRRVERALEAIGRHMIAFPALACGVPSIERRREDVLPTQGLGGSWELGGQRVGQGSEPLTGQHFLAMTVRQPDDMLSQRRYHLLGQNRKSILGSLAAMNVDRALRAVNVLDS